jgi:hypothetical protein
MPLVTFPTPTVYANPKAPSIAIAAPPALTPVKTPTITFSNPIVGTIQPRDLIFPIRSPRTAKALSDQSASRCIGPAANLPMVCTFNHNCSNPRSWEPKGDLPCGWVSCLHLIGGVEYWVNSIATPNGQSFTVGIRLKDRSSKQRAINLHELNEALVVYWGEQYLLQCANQPAVRTLMAAHGIPETTPFELPVLTVVESCGRNDKGSYIAGTAKDNERIKLSSWVLFDLEETCGTLRHELAHIIVYICGLCESDPHGDNFKRVLQAIAPTTSNKDRYWHRTPAIEAAIERIHGDEAQFNRQLREVGL